MSYVIEMSYECPKKFLKMSKNNLKGPKKAVKEKGH